MEGSAPRYDAAKAGERRQEQTEALSFPGSTILGSFRCSFDVGMRQRPGAVPVDPSAPLRQRQSGEALVPHLSKQQHPLGLCGTQQALEQDENLSRLQVNLSVDGPLIEPVGSKPRVDLGRSDWINSPAQSVLRRVVLGFVAEFRSDTDHVDAPKRGLNRLLAIGFKKLVAQQPVALDLPGKFSDIDQEGD
jgi:hypothetical protein